MKNLKYITLGICSVFFLILSIFVTPKVEAFEVRDIIIVCGTDASSDCFSYQDDLISIDINGGIEDIRFE